MGTCGTTDQPAVKQQVIPRSAEPADWLSRARSGQNPAAFLTCSQDQWIELLQKPCVAPTLWPGDPRQFGASRARVTPVISGPAPILSHIPSVCPVS